MYVMLTCIFRNISTSRSTPSPAQKFTKKMDLRRRQGTLRKVCDVQVITGILYHLKKVLHTITILSALLLATHAAPHLRPSRANHCSAGAAAAGSGVGWGGGGLLSINSETAVILMSSSVLSVKMYMDSALNEFPPGISP